MEYFVLKTDLSIVPIGDFNTYCEAGQRGEAMPHYVATLDPDEMLELANRLRLLAKTVGKILAFNTRRFYSAQGQRIAAMAMPGGVVAFLDLDRGIWGTTTVSCALTAAEVMRAYDYGRYCSAIDEATRIKLREAARNVPSARQAEILEVQHG